MTTALGGNTYDARRHVGRRGASHRRAFSVGLGMVGLTTVVISAWGAIIPYVGPTFGYSADGSSAWEWNLTHSVLALVPGAIGVLVGLFYFAPVRTSTAGRRLSLGAAGVIAVACGAWFVIGPVAWPVITDMGQYFVAAPPLRNLANQVGYSLGPGLILAACGAYAIGWATRHNLPLGATAAPAPEEAWPGPGRVDVSPAVDESSAQSAPRRTEGSDPIAS